MLYNPDYPSAEPELRHILAVAPGEVVLAAGNDKVHRKLVAAGVTVHEFAGTEVAVKGDGGPTCLTQPLWRA